MSSIPAHLKELLKNLEFLAMIEKGKKPCLGDMTFVDATSWTGAFKRSRGSESKKNLLSFIDGIIEQTFTAIVDNRNREYITLLVAALSKAKIGISNTQTTYKDHPSFIAQIRVLLTNIELQLKKYETGEDSSSSSNNPNPNPNPNAHPRRLN